MHQEAVVEAVACRNCGAELRGAYCHNCGEPRPHHDEFAWKHFVHDVLHEFIHLDGKIFRTLWLLVARAGFLTKEYWEGHRTSYIRPLRLYIVIAAIHVLAMSHTFYRMDMFKSRDSSGGLARMVARIAEDKHITPEAAEEQLNLKITKVYSIAQYFAVLGFALLPWVMYRRRRPTYIAHLIFALHVYSFYFLLTAAISPFITATQWMRSPLPVVTFVYLAFAVRTLYGHSWWKALGSALVLRFGLFVTEFVVLSIALSTSLFLAKAGGH